MKNKTGQEIKNQTVGYVAGALGLVAGLAWNDAVKALIESVFPVDKSSILIKFIYAALVTIVVVMATRYLIKSEEEDSNEDSKK